ncbi:MAG: hypothetical protein U9N60_03210, partial [Thermodesulfobacteriota bacterium]|nr:hypothetical protein [Thermodesulfobacteriota bacterium]
SKRLVQKRADLKMIFEQTSTWDMYHSCWRCFDLVDISLVEFEKSVHPVIDSVPDCVTVNGVCNILQDIRVFHGCKGVVFFCVGDASLVHFKLDGIITVEIELTVKRGLPT